MDWFIQLHRSMLEWEWYDDINTKILFLHILLKANYNEKEWRWIKIERWAFITSLSNLSKETWLSIKQVRLSLNKLKRTQEVAHEGQTSYSLIKVKNYDKYQKKGKRKDKKRATTNNILSKDNIMQIQNLIEKWNNVKKYDKHWKWTLWKDNVINILNEIVENYKKEEIENWIRKYLKDIKERKEWDYKNHRFTIDEFFTRERWFKKFYNII